MATRPATATALATKGGDQVSDVGINGGAATGETATVPASRERMITTSRNEPLAVSVAEAARLLASVGPWPTDVLAPGSCPRSHLGDES